MGYSFIDHTADVAAELTGGTAAELFASAAQALTDTITDLAAVHPVVTQFVTLAAASLEDLLVSGADVTLREDTDRWYLDGHVIGEPFDPARHPSRVLVKSATYHGLNVVHQDGTWKARIVFDI